MPEDYEIGVVPDRSEFSVIMSREFTRELIIAIDRCIKHVCDPSVPSQNVMEFLRDLEDWMN